MEICMTKVLRFWVGVEYERTKNDHAGGSRTELMTRILRKEISFMQLHSARTSHPRLSPKETIPYSSAALRQDLDRLRGIWEDVQSSRDRNAIYGYLTAVYGLVSWWAAEGRETDRARRALRLQYLDASDREDPFAAVIRCTAEAAKADKRTKSKWPRVMRYAAAYKLDSEPLEQFVKRKGGINSCVARFSPLRGSP